MGFLAMILGPLMRMLYQMIPNFAVTMIVFTVIIKLLMLPLMIKQQKSMAKMSVFTPMINEIQQKYKNNQEKMQEEMVKFQQEYGYSPTAGCLPMLINMLVLFGMVEVVYRPVQYILGIPKEAISAACTALEMCIRDRDGTLHRPLVVSKFRNFISASRQFLQCFHFELCIHQRLF